MNVLKYIYLLSMGCVAVSCSRPDVGREIQTALGDAYEAVKGGNYDEAVSMCDAVVLSADSSAMSWKDYCEAAAIYAAAYDHDVSTESSMVSATLCIDRARSLQPDSVAVFIGSMPPDMTGSLNTVIRTLDGLNVDRTTIGEHEEEFNEPDSTDIHTH